MNLLLKRLSSQPGTMALRPVLAGRIGAAMPQEEGEQLLASPHQVHGCIYTRTNQIAKSFVRSVRHPHSRQVAGSMQDRQLLRVPRSVLIRSPGLRGMSEVAATVQLCPSAVSWR